MQKNGVQAMLNQANYESFVDPNGGSWIKINHKNCKNVVWRPVDINVTEDGKFSFGAEFLEGPGIAQVTEENQEAFGNMAKAIITDIIAAEQAELEQMAEAFESVEVETSPEDAIHSRIEEMDIMQGGTQVSPALMPQDLQADLASIANVIGGVKPTNG